MDEKQPNPVGRPRSEEAREAVLNAVDDLLVEIGYAAMTMKNIAERAGVSRQTVYRWWSTKGEILFEACAIDAKDELAIPPSGDLNTDVSNYLEALVVFLTASPAGLAYRALIGEAQHSAEIADLLKTADLLGDSARAVVAGHKVGSSRDQAADLAITRLVAPVFYWILSGRDPAALSTKRLAREFLAALS